MISSTQSPIPTVATPALNERLPVGFLGCLVRTQGYRHALLKHHSERVGSLAGILARAAGQDGGYAQELEAAAELHDLGKFIVPDTILNKAGPLSREEWQVMRGHCVIGFDILSGSGHPLIDLAARVSLHHHEAYDGSGYPFGERGNDIPLEGRIVAICDVYDALREARPYRSAFDHAAAVRIIVKGDERTKPAHFDPQLLNAFARVQDEFCRLYDKPSDGLLRQSGAARPSA